MRLLVVLLVFGFVCREINSEEFQKIGEKSYYIENDKKLDWFQARDKCKSMDAHLVSIQNYKEWMDITDCLISSKSYWVDIRDVNSNFNFISDTSEQEAPFLKWSHRQPRRKTDYDCVKLKIKSHKMKTKYCSQENHYICEANSRPAPVYETRRDMRHDFTNCFFNFSEFKKLVY